MIGRSEGAPSKRSPDQATFPNAGPAQWLYAPCMREDRWSRRLGYSALALCVFVLSAAGCGSSPPDDIQTYSIAETRDAFGGFDLQVVYADPPGESPRGASLRPAAGASFLVSVERSDEVMDQGWATSSALWAADGAFAARRANVAVTPNDEGPQLSDKDRERVLAALNALPDRGDPVTVARP
jgi:hypothetical protein